MKKTSVLIRGWRGINHSYALVNQFQLLALLKREEMALFHEDVPFYQPEWQLSAGDCGFTAADAARIAAIPPPDGTADVLLRIAYPYRLHGGAERRIFCFGTSEFLSIHPGDLYEGEDNDRSYANPEVEIITPSNWSKAGFVNHGIRAERVHVVPHGIDPTYFHPLSAAERLEARTRLGLPPDAFVFLNVGGMSPNKGIDKLVLAFAHIRRTHANALLLLKEQKYLYHEGAKYILDEAKKSYPHLFDAQLLRSIGVINRNLSFTDLRALYGAADAYISPYRGEGFGLTPLEAAACGTPIAVTAGGSTDDYAQTSFALKIASHRHQNPGSKDITVRVEIDSLIACMEALIERRTPGLDMAKGAAWIAQNFTWDKAAEKLGALFTA
jgi:glycosyltransferase involved in cell wall biosynthesis